LWEWSIPTKAADQVEVGAPRPEPVKTVAAAAITSADTIAIAAARYRRVAAPRGPSIRAEP